MGGINKRQCRLAEHGQQNSAKVQVTEIDDLRLRSHPLCTLATRLGLGETCLVLHTAADIMMKAAPGAGAYAMSHCTLYRYT